MTATTQTNQLIHETSPYLLQHAHNPVDWYAWNENAFKKARQENKLIFLSIGYSTCHWCHVMERESFENEAIAEILNKGFVSIKVDREERPDVDQAFMNLGTSLFQAGGWPLSVFLTPDRKPFFATTYIPPHNIGQRKGMPQLLDEILEMWIETPEKLTSSSEEVLKYFNQPSSNSMDQTELSFEILENENRSLKSLFDQKYGGFAQPRKFPTGHVYKYLNRQWIRNRDEETKEFLIKTLTNMRLGGLYDQIGFGFHRYSTDTKWKLPHFEKMLYDQAMMIDLYSEAWLLFRDPLFKQTVEENISYVFNSLYQRGTGFSSAEDADSEGEEGRFYFWSIPELKEALTEEEFEWFLSIFPLSEEGNFYEEATQRKLGTNLLHFIERPQWLAQNDELHIQYQDIREKLFQLRESRVHPFKDDKILLGWNALMVHALFKAGRIFQNNEWIEQAESTLNWLKKTFYQDNQWHLSYRLGKVSGTATLDDLSYLLQSYIEGYQVTGKYYLFEEALTLQNEILNEFHDPQSGGFFYTSSESEVVLKRMKEAYDGALPSGYSISVCNLVRLANLTDIPEWLEIAKESIAPLIKKVSGSPSGYSQLLMGVDLLLSDWGSVVFYPSGEQQKKTVLSVFQESFLMDRTNLIVLNDSTISKIQQKLPAASYMDQTMKGKWLICSGKTCYPEMKELKELEALLQEQKGLKEILGQIG